MFFAHLYEPVLLKYLSVISESADEITDTYYNEVDAMTKYLKDKRPELTGIDEMLVDIAVCGLAGYEKQFIRLLVNGQCANTDNDTEDLMQFFSNFYNFKDVVSFTDFTSFSAMKACFGVGYEFIDSCKTQFAKLVDNRLVRLYRI